MAEGEVNITAFDDAGTLDGTEKIYLVRGATDYNTTPNAIVAAEASARALGDTAQTFAAVVLTNPFTAGKAPRRIGDFAVNTTSGEIWQSTAITNAAASWNCISAGYYNGRIITNWDTHTQSGDITSYSTATGAPTSTESFYGRHINSNAGTVNAVQWAIGYTTNKIYMRTKTASTWGAWSVGITSTELGYLAGVTSNIQTQLSTLYTDINNVTGAVSHYKRVLADAGGVLDRTWLLRAYEEYIKQRPETLRLYIPELGAKLRTSGLNRYGVKAYDMSSNAKDAVQATDATQPYMTVGAAPNARLGMRFVQGQTQTGLMDFDDVVFAAGDSWTLTMRVKVNKRGGRLYLGSTAFIGIQNSAVTMANGSVNILAGSIEVKSGQTYTLEFQYSNGVGLIIANGIPLTTTTTSGAITFGQISYTTAYPFDGSLYALHLTNTRKSAYQSQLDHTFLSTIFPDMESVTIGNQVWSTDNFAGTVAGDGTVVQEVQSAATAADATNIYNATYAATTGTAAVKDLAATKAAAMWCHYDNLAANGAVYGKLYNWYAVHLFDLFPPVKGWRVPSKADFDQLVEVNGGSTVAGGRLKVKFGRFNEATSTNESGFSGIAGGRRDQLGAFGSIDTTGQFLASTPASATETNVLLLTVSSAASSISITGTKERMRSLRLLRNEPAGDNEKSYTSGLFTTDITSVAKQIPISFGRMVDAIRIKSENALTAIEAKLYNAAGTAVATLITAKTIGAGETKMFTIGAVDYVGLPQDGSVRVTAAGNSGAAVGMEIEVLTHKGVLS